MAISLLSLAGMAQAAEPPPALLSGRVDRPAHVVRSAQSVTLLARMDLQAGDHVTTGVDGRAEVRFGDATSLTLAPHGELQLHSTLVAPAGAGLRARLLQGQARIAVDARSVLYLNVGSLRLRSGEAAYVADAAAGGTVCVDAGEIAVYPPGDETPVRVASGCVRLDADAGLIHETGLPTHAAILDATRFAPVDLSMPTSGWTIVVASLADASSAEAEARGLLGEGLPARTLAFHDTWRVAIGGFAEATQAQRYAEQLRQTHGLFEAWVTPY